MFKKHWDCLLKGTEYRAEIDQFLQNQKEMDLFLNEYPSIPKKGI